MNNLKSKIYESWLPKLRERYEAKGISISESKLKTIAEMAHVRKMYENATSTTSVPGRGKFAFGNNPMAGGAEVGSGEVFQDLFGVFLDVSATTVGMDIIPTIPMSKSNISVYIVEPIYTGGINGESNVEKPLVFMIDVSGASVKTKLADNKIGTEYGVTGGLGILDKVKYIGRDRIKGKYIFEVTAIKTGKEADYKAKSLEEILDQVKIDTDIDYTAKSVDYVSGFNNFIAGYSGSGVTTSITPAMSANRSRQRFKPMNREQGERTPYKSVGLRQWSRNFSAETFHVNIEYTTEQIQDMKMDHDVDALELGDAVLRDQLTQSINGHILSEVFAYGWQHHYNMHKLNSAFNLNFNANTTDAPAPTEFEGITPGVDLQIAATKGELVGNGVLAENMSSLQKRLVTRLAYASSVIKVRSRRGKGNTIVLGATHGSALSDIKGYSVAPFSNSLSDEDGLEYAGEFKGIQVYEDALMDLTDNRIAIFRKGSEKDPGLKFCPYLLSEKISTIAEGTMSFKEALKSRYALVGAGSSPELNYLTLVVEDSAYKLV